MREAAGPPGSACPSTTSAPATPRWATFKHLPVDELKIDRSYIAELNSSAGDAALVRSVIDLGHELGLPVVAEGIETPETVASLKGLRCDVGQGYLFARPQAADELSTWLSTASAALLPQP